MKQMDDYNSELILSETTNRIDFIVLQKQTDIVFMQSTIREYPKYFEILTIAAQKGFGMTLYLIILSYCNDNNKLFVPDTELSKGAILSWNKLESNNVIEKFPLNKKKNKKLWDYGYILTKKIDYKKYISKRSNIKHIVKLGDDFFDKRTNEYRQNILL